eukprot:2295248-Rhodomonas_salina.2
MRGHQRTKRCSWPAVMSVCEMKLKGGLSDSMMVRCVPERVASDLRPNRYSPSERWLRKSRERGHDGIERERERERERETLEQERTQRVRVGDV